MKLLSIKDNSAAKDKQRTLQILEAKDLHEEIERRRAKLNDLHDTFDQTLRDQQKKWSEEIEKHADWKNVAQAEVVELEKRRFLALLPLEDAKKDLNNQQQAFAADKAVFEIEKEQFEENKLSFAVRLDQVAERELQVSKDEKSLAIRRKGVEDQAASIAAQSKQLSIHLTEFSREIERKNEAFAIRETAVKAREDVIEIERSRLQQWETDLSNRELGLKDKYRQLEKTTKEIYGRRTL